MTCLFSLGEKYDGNFPEDKQLAMSANNGDFIDIANKFSSEKESKTEISTLEVLM